MDYGHRIGARQCTVARMETKDRTMTKKRVGEADCGERVYYG